MKKKILFISLTLVCAFSIAFSEEAKKEMKAKDEAEVQKEAPVAEVKEADYVTLISVAGTAIYRNEVLEGLRYSLRMNKEIKPEDFSQSLTAIEDYLVDVTLVDNEAKKNNINIPDEQFQKEYDDMTQKMSKTREGFLDSLKQRGLEEEKFKKTFRNNLIRNEFLKELIEPKIIVSDEEAKEFYEGNKNLMTKPENVVVSHILIRTEENDEKKKAALEDIRNKIVKGESFEKMAKNFSDCPSSRNNGSLGSVFKGQTVPEFEEMAYKLEIGEISPVIKTQFGYHILKVTEKNPETVTSFEEAKESIINHLKAPKRKEVFAAYMETLRANADVKVYEELQPTYENTIPEDRRPKEKIEEAPAKEEAKKEEASKPEDGQESNKDSAKSNESKEKPAKK